MTLILVVIDRHHHTMAMVVASNVGVADAAAAEMFQPTRGGPRCAFTTSNTG
jgi:hypothetical protein